MPIIAEQARGRTGELPSGGQCALSQNRRRRHCFLERDQVVHGQRVNGLPVVGEVGHAVVCSV